jgi:uncharacterized protein DUF4277
MPAPAVPVDLRLESLEVGAAPLVRLFLTRLDLPGLFQRYLPPQPGRAPALPSDTVLAVLLTNLLLARQPLYALADWAARRVPEHLGLAPGQAALLNDDRVGRALDHLHRADRARLLTALVKQAVTEFAIDLSELHQDTTTVTNSLAYAAQPPAERTDRPPRITFGYNKDHRPDLKQLLFSITISADGAVPIHGSTYDGNTSDDQVHIDTWDFVHSLVGHSDFLYVADSKLCTRENMSHIASRQGRFLTVMPRTRSSERARACPQASVPLRRPGSATISRTSRWPGVRCIGSQTRAAGTGRMWSTTGWRGRNVLGKATDCCGSAARRKRNKTGWAGSSVWSVPASAWTAGPPPVGGGSSARPRRRGRWGSTS